MLTPPRRFSRLARFTRLSCPACSAPMVGTKPMSSPACRQAIACSCMTIADSMTRPPPWPIPAEDGLLPGGLADGVFVLRCREGARSHVLVESARGGLDRFTELRILADELCHVIGVETEDILDDQHLGIAVGTRPDPDRRYGQALADALPQHTGNPFQHDG